MDFSLIEMDDQELSVSVMVVFRRDGNLVGKKTIALKSDLSLNSNSAVY